MEGVHNLKEVVILDAVRTPIGKYKGSLTNVSAVDLGATAIKGLLEKNPAATEGIDQVIMGNVLSAGLGQNIARQSAVQAGLEYTVPATTVNEVCGSGLKAVIMAQQLIQLGEANLVIAGGTENMSQAPLVKKYDSETNDYLEPVNSMLVDGLTDAYSQAHMGLTAENVAETYQISRQAQDDYAFQSQQRAIAATNSGVFQEEIVPVQLADGQWLTVDEGIRFQSEREKLATLRTVFKEDGTVTAGNAATLNDGASAILLASKEYALANQLPYLAELGSYSEIGMDPQLMGVAPIYAIEKLMKKTELSIEEIDLFEINEAFASASVATMQTLGIPSEKLNIHGSGISLGHPLGATGARIVTTLVHELIATNKQTGVAALCIGGGLGLALLVKRPTDAPEKKFYQLSRKERLEKLVKDGKITSVTGERLYTETALPENIATNLIENQISEVEIPLGVIERLQVDGKNYTVPMATEEPSVIAAANNAAKLTSLGGGITTEHVKRQMLGQIVFQEVADVGDLEQALLEKEAAIFQIATKSYPSIVKRGGGMRELRIRTFEEEQFVSLDIMVDVCDAMGANILNTILEGIADACRQWFPKADILFSILSNYASESLVKARCQIPFSALATKNLAGESVAEKIVEASRYSKLDIYRGTTHNKGIMNGIDAVVLATGNDTRAIAAGIHAFAARKGSYQGLTEWVCQEEALVGEILLPLPVATVGGATKVLPKAQQALELVNVSSAKELASVIAAVGLGQNLAALKALVTEGIQKGHMALQMRSLAMSVGALDEEVDILVKQFETQTTVNSDIASQLLAKIRMG